MGGVLIRARLVDFFKKHPDETVTVDQIAEEIQEARKRVQAGVYSLQESGQLPTIQTLQRGNVWRYTPTTTKQSHTRKSGRVFEEIKELRSGEVLLESEDGDLYMAYPLEGRK